MAKRTLLAILLVIAICGSITGCKKSKDQNIYMLAKVNNSSFNAIYCGSYLQDDFLMVQGYNEIPYTYSVVYPMIELKLWKSQLITSTYNIGGRDSTTAYYYRTPTDSSQAVDGVINITWVSPEICGEFQGTFNFTCADGTVIKEGLFRSAPLCGLL